MSFDGPPPKDVIQAMPIPNIIKLIDDWEAQKTPPMDIAMIIEAYAFMYHFYHDARAERFQAYPVEDSA